MTDVAPRSRISFDSALTFIGMVVVALSVYFTRAGSTDSSVAVLQAEMANAKSSIAQLRGDNLQLRSDNAALSTAFNTQIDKIKDSIHNVEMLINDKKR